MWNKSVDLTWHFVTIYFRITQLVMHSSDKIDNFNRQFYM